MVQSPQIEYLNICYVTSFYLFFTHFLPQNGLHNQGADTKVSNFSHEYSVDSIKRIVHLTFHGLFFSIKSTVFLKNSETVFLIETV